MVSTEAEAPGIAIATCSTSGRDGKRRCSPFGPLGLALTFAAVQVAGGCSTPTESGRYRPAPGSGGGADGGAGAYAPPGSLPDADGDGFPDIAEVAAGTDPNDPMSRIPEDDFFVVLPYQGPVENRTLRFNTDIALGDVMFLVDTTSSMEGERQNLIAGLVNVIIPGIEAQIPNVHFAAAGFDDYPVTGFGRAFDVPFYLLAGVGRGDADVGAWSVPATCLRGGPIGELVPGANGRPDILEAVEGLPCHSGYMSAEESYVPALWVTATGNGLDWPGGSLPSRTCPPVLDAETGVGYPCFRAGALPIVVLIGDAPFHNGPAGTAPYPFATPSYDDAVTALSDIGARVLPIFSGDPAAIDDYHRIARDTGAVRADGSPLTFTLDPRGLGLDQTVVTGVAELVGGSPQDVSTRTENRPGNPDDVDATRFILSITPVEGYVAGAPGRGYASKDGATFYQTIPGTTVDFAVEFKNDTRPSPDEIEIFRARIVVTGNAVADLDARNVYIVVPPEGVAVPLF